MEWLERVGLGGVEVVGSGGTGGGVRVDGSGWMGGGVIGWVEE